MIESNSLQSEAKYRQKPSEPRLIEVQERPRGRWYAHSIWGTPEMAARMVQQFAKNQQIQLQEAERENQTHTS